MENPHDATASRSKDKYCSRRRTDDQQNLSLMRDAGTASGFMK